MAIILNDNLKINAGKPIDSKYLNSLNQPYTDTAAVIAAIPQASRHLGLTINVANVDYWWHLDTTDGALVIKDSGIASTGITKAGNGLTKVGNTVIFGGTLTGTTTITDSRVTPLGIQYAGDYSSTYTQRSLVDAAYVTGKTSAISSRVSTIEGQYVTGATNGISKSGAHNVCLGGAIIQNTNLTGAYKFGIFTCEVDISGSTTGVNLGGCVYLKTPPSGSGGLLCVNPSTGQICQTNLSTVGGITGATNGLTNCGSQRIGLGGSLCADTVIQSDGGNHKLTLGRFCGLNLATSGETDMILVSQSNGTVLLKSESGAGTIGNGTTNAVGIYMDFNGTSGFNIFDNRSGSNQTGIVYGADYSTHYVPRSLVDKGYVDSVATGLNVHAAVVAATTGPITLSGNQTIDGITTTNGMRILVKNQASGATNGIYSASTSTWGRTSDYQTNIQITNGDLIPVTSGSTQNSSIWVLTTPDPITVGVTSLDFSEFSTIIDVQQGAGIAITQVGGVHTVCVQLGNNASTGCGLSTVGTGLCINTSIANCGLTYNAGLLCVNACNCGTVPAINVGYNTTSNALVVACSDLVGAIGAIQTANNGLTKVGSNVVLGGALTGATTITMPSSPASSLTFTDSRVAKTGIQYGGDYSSSYVARSLVDAAYVTGKTSSLNSRVTIIEGQYVTGATNGIVKYDAHNVCLTSINQAILNSAITGATNGLTKVGRNVVLGGSLTGNTTFTNSSSQSLRYSTDSSSSYVARSIPDVGWVTGNTSGLIAVTDNQIVFKNNTKLSGSTKLIYCHNTDSLVVNASSIGLGLHSVAMAGGYTCSTALCAIAMAGGIASNPSSIAMAGACAYGNYSVAIGSTNIVNSNYAAIIGGQSNTLSSGNTNSVLLGGTSITVTANNYANTVVVPSLAIWNTPTTGATSDAVLVWNSTDKLVKKVVGSGLGDKNNIYQKTTITTSTLLSTGSSYVILANAGSAITITLPATPLNGQAFKFKDVSGNALINNITINGNSHNIDGSSSGTINTNYGALELMYDSVLSAWFSMAFIN